MMKRKIYNADITSGLCASGMGMSYLKNMIMKNGIPQKRSGWKTLYNFRSYTYEPCRINGIYEYKGKDKTSLLVHAGQKLYKCSYDLREITEIPCEGGAVIKDKRSRGYMFGTMLWLTGMGQPLIYDGVSVKCVQNGPLCYVPVTATDIRDKELCLPHKKGEEPNVLTGKRINTLRAKKKELLIHKFFLDAPVKYKTPFRLKASFRVRKSTDEADELTTDYIGTDNDGNEVNTVVYTELYTDSVEDGVEIISTEKPVDKLGRSVSIGDDFKFLIQVRNGNELYMMFDAAAHESTGDNIEVEFTAQTEQSASIDEVEAFSVAAMKNGGNVAAISDGTGRLFLGTAKEGMFYFPKGDITVVDSEAERITAVLPTSQGGLAIYKENGFYILLLEGEKERELLSSADILGCLGPFCATRLNNECLALGIDGVYGLKDAASRNSISTSQVMKSAPIQDELDRIPVPTLEEGAACAHKGKYYLFLNDRAYVAQRADSGDGLVWCRLENCPARVALSAGSSLYMGRENGDVAVFDGGYTDRRDYVLNERERDFVFRDNGLTTVAFNYAIGVKDGDKISLEKHYALWARGVLNHKTNNILLNPKDCFEGFVYIGPCKGQEVLLVDTRGYVVYEGEITDFNPSEYTFHCAHIGLSQDTELLVYLKRDEKTEYTLKTQGGFNYLYLGNRPLTLYSTELDRLYIRDEREIECEICTPITNLGEGEEKTLLGISVTLSPESRCSLELGYETGTGFFQRQLRIGSHMSFCGLDFNDFNFNSRFKRTINVKCLERNVDYIRLWLRSVKGEEFGVEQASLIYTGGAK